MSASNREVDRQVLPRWRDLAATVAHGELGPATRREPTPGAPKDPMELARDTPGERSREFREHRSLSFAADLLSVSIVLGATPETADAAELVVKNEASPAMLRATASAVLERDEDSLAPASEPVRRQEIARLRHGLRGNPRNALRWVELSRHYINEGHVRKSATAMRIAVNMAPRDRYILRCAVRLWTHLSEPDRALSTLGNARSAVLGDPWLLASEIATSSTAGKSSPHIRRGREMVALDAHTPIALSELRSALATIEMQAGGARRARRLFHGALLDPNENSVAQIEWASTRISGLDLGEEQLQQSAEARARRAADDEDIETTLEATTSWLFDQPFSSEPAIFGSYHASMYGRFADGVRLAELGLHANPRDPLLLNNLAFCLAATDQWQAADAKLREIQGVEDQGMRATITATEGFIRLRSGDVQGGRALYEDAISHMSNPRDALRAELMLAAEELRIGEKEGETRASRLIEVIERTETGQLKIWLRLLPREGGR